MAMNCLKSSNLKWLYFDEANSSTINYLRENYNFHPLDLEDLMAEKQHPKVDFYDDYLFLIIHLPDLQENKQRLATLEIDIFVNKNQVITIEKKKSPVLHDFFIKAGATDKLKNELMENGAGFLLYKILESLFNSCNQPLDYLSELMHTMEDEIYSGRQDNETFRRLAELRRMILNFRKIINPEHYVISSLVTSSGRVPFLPEKLAVYFDNIHDFIKRTWIVLDNYKEVLIGMYETNESVMAHRTNETIKMLTVISVGLLPLTLLSGIYGMNVAGLPFADNPIGVIAVFGGLISIILLIIFNWKRKGWF